MADGALPSDGGGSVVDSGAPSSDSSVPPRDGAVPPGTTILFEEPFNDPRENLTFAFDGWFFGYGDRPWMRAHQTAGGVRGGPYFRATSTFATDDFPGSGGTNYFFAKTFDEVLAAHNRDFSVRHCTRYSAGIHDARVRGSEVGQKINYFTGSGGGIFYYAFTGGTFVPRERVVGQTSGARGDLFAEHQSCTPACGSQRITNVVGTFVSGETLLGQTSLATATFDRLEPEERVIAMNHFWHGGSPESGFRGDGLMEIAWYDITSDHYFGSNSDLNEVRHTNFMLIQEHYDEWICLETRFELDQVPWNVEIYVTTEAGAATLPSGTTALDGGGRRQFNDYLYIRYQNPIAPALEEGFGVESNQWGAYGHANVGDVWDFDEYAIATGHIGHPF